MWLAQLVINFTNCEAIFVFRDIGTFCLFGGNIKCHYNTGCIDMVF